MESSWGRALCVSSVMSVKGLNMMWSCKLCSVIAIHRQCKLKVEILSEIQWSRGVKNMLPFKQLTFICLKSSKGENVQNFSKREEKHSLVLLK